MPARPTETFEILALLCRRRVDFIVVGMTAGVLQGAPALTFDLDVVYSRDPENVVRLLGVLGELEAVFRDDARRIPPNASHLESAGRKLLETRLGDLDVLGAIGVGLDYAALLPDAVVLIAGDLEVRVLGLARLIEFKERAGRPKDLAALPVLRSALDRISARRSSRASRTHVLSVVTTDRANELLSPPVGLGPGRLLPFMTRGRESLELAVSQRARSSASPESVTTRSRAHLGAGLGSTRRSGAWMPRGSAGFTSPWPTCPT